MGVWQRDVPGDPPRAPLTFVLNATFAPPPASDAAAQLDVGLRIAVVTYNGTALPTPLHVRVANDLPWDAATGISTLAQVDP